MARPEGGSWAARIAALAVFCGCVALTLSAGWNLVMTPYSWATLSWAGGLVVGVVVMPLVLYFFYKVIVLSTWHHQGSIADGTENRLWWLGQYMRTITLPYGLLVIASAFGWRLSMGNNVPLSWRWCVVIITAYALVAIVASGGIPADPEMPYLRRIPIRRQWAFLVGSIAVIVFAAAHFAELKWLRIALFVAVFFVVAFWAGAAAIGAARLFLRVDHGQSTSYPVDWPWH
jgi:hypothetical protein